MRPRVRVALARTLGLTLAIPVSVSVLSCLSEESLEWPGIKASGSGGTYTRVNFRFDEGITPGFTVRMPDNRLLGGSQLTPGALSAYGAELKTYPTGSHAIVHFDNGYVGVYWRENGRKWLVTVAGSSSPYRAAGEGGVPPRPRLEQSPPEPRVWRGSVVQVGDRDGGKVFSIPITREQLIELFGEPTQEYRRQRPLGIEL